MTARLDRNASDGLLPVGDPFSPTGIGVPPEVEIVVSDEQASPDVDADRWAALAAAVLRAEGRGGELTLTFVDRHEIAELNAEHMGQQGPTDVLSFPLDDDPAAIGAGPVLLGDVVICPDVAREAAPDHAGTLDDELALLTVHGVLHILGFDHVDAAERIEMRARERAMLEQHHWRGPAPVAFRHEQIDA